MKALFTILKKRYREHFHPQPPFLLSSRVCSQCLSVGFLALFRRTSQSSPRMALPLGSPSEDLLVGDEAASSTEGIIERGSYPGRSRGRTTSSKLRGISTTSTGPAGAIMIRAGPEQGMKGRLLFGVAIGSCDPHVHRADLRLGIALLPSSDVVLSWEEQ